VIFATSRKVVARPVFGSVIVISVIAASFPISTRDAPEIEQVVIPGRDFPLNRTFHCTCTPGPAGTTGAAAGAVLVPVLLPPALFVPVAPPELPVLLVLLAASTTGDSATLYDRSVPVMDKVAVLPFSVVSTGVPRTTGFPSVGRACVASPPESVRVSVRSMRTSTGGPAFLADGACFDGAAVLPGAVPARRPTSKMAGTTNRSDGGDNKDKISVSPLYSETPSRQGQAARP
jgi:hypothetical protein